MEYEYKTIAGVGTIRFPKRAAGRELSRSVTVTGSKYVVRAGAKVCCVGDARTLCPKCKAAVGAAPAKAVTPAPDLTGAIKAHRTAKARTREERQEDVGKAMREALPPVRPR